MQTRCKPDAHTHTLIPTGFPAAPPGLSFSFVKSFTTVVPRLYNAVAKLSSSTSRSPCSPGGGGVSLSRGLSGTALPFPFTLTFTFGVLGVPLPLPLKLALGGAGTGAGVGVDMDIELRAMPESVRTLLSHYCVNSGRTETQIWSLGYKRTRPIRNARRLSWWGDGSEARGLEIRIEIGSCAHDSAGLMDDLQQVVPFRSSCLYRTWM